MGLSIPRRSRAASTCEPLKAAVLCAAHERRLGSHLQVAVPFPFPMPLGHERLEVYQVALEELGLIEGVHVIFEATGALEAMLTAAMAGAKIKFTRVNPRQVRDFANALKRLAKTDRIVLSMKMN